MAFSINIMLGETPETSVVQASGDDWHVMTDAERNAFGMTDDLIRAYFKSTGLSVSDVYFREPTPGNLYDCSHWPAGQCPPQTQVHVIATGAHITGATSQPLVLAHKLFENNSSVTGTFSGGVSAQVTNTVTNQWSQSNQITVGAEIGFSVGVVSGKVSFSFTHNWTWGGSESQSVAVGSNDNVSVVLNPGQKVDAQLSIYKGILTVEVDYIANVGGDVLGRDDGNYYSGWASIEKGVLKGKSLLKGSQIITVEYYSNERVTLVDPQTHAVIKDAGPTMKLKGI